VSTPPTLAHAAGVRARRLPTPRGELAALECSPDGAPATPVLLVPGFTGSKEDFIAVLAPIAHAGHPVVSIDQRGQYESAGGDDPTGYEVKSLAEDILSVAEQLGRPIHLVGHSFGGIVSRAAALADPSAFRSLTLLDSGPAGVPEPSAGAARLLLQALTGMDLPTIWSFARARELEAGKRNGTPPPAPEIEEFLRHRFVANHPVALARYGEALISAVDQVDELAATGIPVLVAYGTDDDAWPPALQSEMARRLGAADVALEAAGHSPAATHPDATVAALVRFWSDLPES
jgi:pimeloyl-ACP methyl ester carboxylesterase